MKKYLLLCAGLLACTTLIAQVVYEPLIVDSGFNRDVIAERAPVSVHVAKSYLIADTTRNYWSMATKSVIRTVNTPYFTGQYADELDFTAETGWPDDYRDTIRCIEEDTKNDPVYKDVFFMLAPYDKKQVLTIRPIGGITDYDPSGTSPGIQNGEGTLKFKKVGCYDRVFFLIAAAKEKGASNPREVSTIVHYTDGDTMQAKFQFGGLSGKVGHNVRRINTSIPEGYSEGFLIPFLVSVIGVEFYKKRVYQFVLAHSLVLSFQPFILLLGRSLYRPGRRGG